MISQGHEIAGGIFLEISERLAFMFGDPVEKQALENEDVAWSQAAITFKGGVSGELKLTVPRSLCLDLAANILGLDVDDLEHGPVATDALCELLNVVSGHVVRGLQGNGDPFELTVPSYRELDAGAHRPLLEGEDTLCYDLDGWSVMLTLTLA